MNGKIVGVVALAALVFATLMGEFTAVLWAGVTLAGVVQGSQVLLIAGENASTLHLVGMAFVVVFSFVGMVMVLRLFTIWYVATLKSVSGAEGGHEPNNRGQGSADLQHG